MQIALALGSLYCKASMTIQQQFAAVTCAPVSGHGGSADMHGMAAMHLVCNTLPESACPSDGISEPYTA